MAVAEGTEVRFTERVVGPTVARLAARALARAKKRRNDRGLQRLAQLAERPFAAESSA